MEQALNAVTVAQRVKHAQELFARLSAGNTGGYGGAQFIAADIRKELTEAGKDLSALDPTGRKSASELESALNAATEPKPGDKMPDGTVYSGISPDTKWPMYLTRIDESLTTEWNWWATHKLNSQLKNGHDDWRSPSTAAQSADGAAHARLR